MRKMQNRISFSICDRHGVTGFAYRGAKNDRLWTQVCMRASYSVMFTCTTIIILRNHAPGEFSVLVITATAASSNRFCHTNISSSVREYSPFFYRLWYSKKLCWETRCTLSPILCSTDIDHRCLQL